MPGRNPNVHFRAIAIVVAIVLIASVLLILRPSPEQVVAVSQDTLLRVEGVARGGATVMIERLDGVDTSIPSLVGPLYEITLTRSGMLEDAQLMFSFAEFASAFSISNVAVYRFNRETLSWEVLPTFFDLDTQTISCPLEFSGSVLVGLGNRVL
jgi:hypothetical protein